MHIHRFSKGVVNWQARKLANSQLLNRFRPEMFQIQTCLSSTFNPLQSLASLSFAFWASLVSLSAFAAIQYQSWSRSRSRSRNYSQIQPTILSPSSDANCSTALFQPPKQDFVWFSLSRSKQAALDNY